MANKNWRTNYNAKLIKSVCKDKIKMTVPGLALTNTEHLKKVRMGIPEQAVKVIFDPHDVYPDVRGMDLVDKNMLLKAARVQVQDLKQKGKDYVTEQKRLSAEKKANDLIADEQRIEEIIERKRQKEGK